jgi:hypothetical protein
VYRGAGAFLASSDVKARGSIVKDDDAPDNVGNIFSSHEWMRIKGQCKGDAGAIKNGRGAPAKPVRCSE